MNAKIRLQKGQFHKDIQVVWRKVIVTFYFPRPYDAEIAYKNLKDAHKKKGWRIKEPEKEHKIIVPGEDVDIEYIPNKKIMGMPTKFK